jgi:hypothetical protein
MTVEVLTPHPYPWNGPLHVVGSRYDVPDPAIARALCLAGVARLVEPALPIPKKKKKGR